MIKFKKLEEVHFLAIILLLSPHYSEGAAPPPSIGDRESQLLETITWLTQTTNLSRGNSGVVFNPPPPSSPLNGSVLLLPMIRHVSATFSKVFIFADRPFQADYYMSVAKAMTELGSLGGYESTELIIGFDERTALNMFHFGKQVIQEFPKMDATVIFCPSIFDFDVLLRNTTAEDINDIIDPSGIYQQIEESAKSFRIGFRMKMESCGNPANLHNFMDFLLYFVNGKVKIPRKHFDILARVTEDHSKLDVEAVLQMYMENLENCKTAIESYLEGRGISATFSFSTEWPVTGEESLGGLVRLIRFWEGMSDWAGRTNKTVIFSSAFDVIEGGRRSKYGWWSLSQNESVDGLLFENKREVGLRYAKKKLADYYSSAADSKLLFGPIKMAILFSTLLFVTAVLLTIGYLLKSRNSKYLTAEDISEFFHGGESSLLGRSVEELNGPYEMSNYELERDAFKMDEGRPLGSGTFGKVCMGEVVKGGALGREVAVKMTKVPSPRSALRGLLYEIKILAYLGRHPHIVELVGAYTAELRKGKAFVFLEVCGLGSLESYLRKLNPKKKEGEVALDGEIDQFLLPFEEEPPPLDEDLARDMARWSLEIASGLEFISSKHVVHLDIASRNILLTSAGKQAKITDFGLSRRMHDKQSYLKTQQEPLPWKWMAPESLRRSIFTEKSDVWAFGVLLWEIFSLGDEPYPGLAWEVNFASKLERGLRLGEPSYNCNNVYSVMLRCWEMEPEGRPTFSEVLRALPSPDTRMALNMNQVICPTTPTFEEHVPEQQLTLTEEDDHELQHGESGNLHNINFSQTSGQLIKKSRPCSRAGLVWSLLAVVLGTLIVLIGTVVFVGDDKAGRVAAHWIGDLDTGRMDNNPNGTEPELPNGITFGMEDDDNTTNPSPFSETDEESLDTEGSPHLREMMIRGLSRMLFPVIDRQDLQGLQSLLELGADPNQRNELGESPLFKAASSRNKTFAKSAVTMLIEHGANASLESKDKEGHPFLHKLMQDEHSY